MLQILTASANVGEQIGEEISQVVDVVTTKGFRYVWEEFVTHLRDALPSLVLGLAFAAVSLLLTYLITRLVKRLLTRSKVEKALHYFIHMGIRYLLVGIILISTLGIMGVPLTPIITALGAVGLALSLAVRDSLSNIAGGVFMLFNCPFKAGDYIEIKGVVGTVREIRLTYTVLETSFNRSIFIPNGDFSKATITNYSAAPTRCMELTFSVAPTPGNIDRAKEIILDVLESSGLLLPSPPVSVRVSGHTDSMVQVTCLAWVEPPNLYDLKAYTIQHVRERLAGS
jgi:small conductance mechanosensitive channel